VIRHSSWQSFSTSSNLFGYTFAYDSFQNYYEQEYLRGTSLTAIAWCGSTQSFLLIFPGLWAGLLLDTGHNKPMMHAGAALSTLGAFMLPFSSRYWEVLVTQGRCVGLGCGTLFVTSMALVSWTFAKNESIAVGLMTCGALVGMYRSRAISYILRS
jgi:MFS family permease